MLFILKIDMDNDAFYPTEGDELARILRQVAAKIEGCNWSYCNGICRDYNGNRVGEHNVMEETP